jgi:hypothetical protein
MRIIHLTKGYTAMIDDEDFSLVNQYSWQVRIATSLHAKRGVYDPATQQNRTQFLHNLIMPPPKGFTVDHIDRNGLNCQKSNLRFATRSQQRYNAGNKRGLYRGVHLEKNGKWMARLMAESKTYYSMCYRNVIDAAKAYDELAKRYHGEFASLNFPDEKETK